MTKSGVRLTAKDAVLSFQHVFAMLGATVLVPMLANMSVSVALISSGIGTIIFFFVTKKKVPVYLGSSFAFLGALIGQMGSAGKIGSAGWNLAMAQMSIAILCTGLVYVILSLIVRAIGTDFVRKLFPPIVVGPVIIVIGMSLAATAISNMVVGDAATNLFGASGTVVQTGYIVAAVATAAIIVFVSIFAKGFWKVIPILFGIIGGYIVACCFGIVDFSAIKNNEWVLFQPDVFMKTFGWYGSLGKIWNKDLLKVILSFAPIAIVTFMEHLGDVNASSIVCGKDFIRDPGVHRTLMGDGLATMAAGFFGGPCNTTYGENTAVLCITNNYNPFVIALAGVFAVVLGIFTKVGNIIGTIPAPVIGGASMILYGMIAANGLKTMVEARVNFSDSKNMIVCSVILVIGIGMSAAGQTLNLGKYVSFSPLAVATFVGIILNAIFLLAKTPRPSGLSGTYGGELVTDDATLSEAETQVAEPDGEAGIAADVPTQEAEAQNTERSEEASDASV